MSKKLPEDKMHYVLDNMKLVHYCAHKMHPSYDEYEDYVQEGMVGLCLAATRFDETKGFKFVTFASSYIYGLMKRYRRENTLLSEPRWLKDVRAKIVSYAIEHPEADADEICEALNIPMYKYRECMVYQDYQSLDADIEGKDGSTVTFGEMIPDTSSFDKFFDDLDEEMMIQAETKVVSTLKKLHRDIYDDFFYSNLFGEKIGQEELANKYGIAQATVSRVLRKVNPKVLKEYKGRNI